MAHHHGSDAPQVGSGGRGRRGFTRPLVLPGRWANSVDGHETAEPVDTRGRDLEAVIGDCAVYDESGRRPGRVPLGQAAAAAQANDGFVWIGLQQPTAAEFAQIAAEFALPPLAVEDAVVAHQRPKLEVYGDVVFAVLKPVHYVDHEEVVNVSEIAIFLGPHFVVTVRHGQSDVLAEVRKEIDSAEPELLSYGPTGVFYRAADRIVDEYEYAAAQISEDVEEIEVQVFSGDDCEYAKRIYKLKREVLEFRRAVSPLAAPLQKLADGAIPGIAPAVTPYFRDVHDHLLRATDVLDGQDRMLTDVLNADLAQVTVRQSRTSVRQNEDMRKISAWAAIALVPTAIAGIYGMNFNNIPELHWRYGYFIALGVILTTCVILHRLFRRNGWL
jgi:magnesium transporter